MLERHEIESFLTLAEELHFGRTAGRLRVSTARISQTIAKLERRTGVALFDRTSRRVELTPAGRRLYDELRPAWDRVTAAFEEAVASGRGLTGVLRAAFTDAAGGQLLAGAAELFRRRLPDADVGLREARPGDLVPWLRDGEIDIGLGCLPVDEPGIATGPALVSEARMLAVPAGHPFARRTSVSLEDLARVAVLRYPDTVSASLRHDRAPAATPSGRPIAPGPVVATFGEMLTHIGAGAGVFPVGAHVRRYYARPDVAYVPFDDAPPIEWGLLWRAGGETARVRAFAEAARDLLGGDGEEWSGMSAPAAGRA
ncbi:DNA-binding transcriptional regulator, LysR family [Actinomadura meyerae]|uniref:DNA-binding transcriptional regulator, LysR family n=1 Tax=Actinomadura meyerae TaxID=240840 RepID=A0A239FNP2_9ACTN|nr:LysR family transcriptional regulator [Actinomadura meyerae]SNS58586.1 DNA-binding transcriptional regulator, LysR family [Actinomadura meyerae]